MSENSKIEWTDHTFNPWWGCEKVSAGCKNCYAESLDNRYHHEKPHLGPDSSRKAMSLNHWMKPFAWNREAQLLGKPAKVFCASMVDVFEDHPQVIEWRKQLFEIIEATPCLIWQLLTKRPENIMKFIPEAWQAGLPGHVWIGTTVENQEAADLRIPHLMKVPAAVRFLSCEPLLGPIDFYKTSAAMLPDKTHPWRNEPILYGIHWMIVGGESGPNARPMHPDWARMLLDQCCPADVAFFFKQWGEWRQYDHYAGDNVKPLGMFQDNVFRTGNIVWDHKKESVHMAKVGKKEAGRFLDGRTWDEFPNHQAQAL